MRPNFIFGADIDEPISRVDTKGAGLVSSYGAVDVQGFCGFGGPDADVAVHKIPAAVGPVWSEPDIYIILCSGVLDRIVLWACLQSKFIPSPVVMNSNCILSSKPWGGHLNPQTSEGIGRRRNCPSSLH